MHKTMPLLSWRESRFIKFVFSPNIGAIIKINFTVSFNSHGRLVTSVKFVLITFIFVKKLVVLVGIVS